MKLAEHKLNEIADLNPDLSTKLGPADLVSFVPMAAVSAEGANVANEEFRQYSEVAKGYTPFRNRDILVAKITPCFENGKIVQANIAHQCGFASTEFHVVSRLLKNSDCKAIVSR